MSEIFFTSDLHIGHKLVSGLRGFNNYDPRPQEFGLPVLEVPDTDAHDHTLAHNWDAVVKPEDTVYVLGDISINGGQHALDWIAARPGTKHLISGNHDPVHPAHWRTATKTIPLWSQYFETIQPFIRRKLMGQTVLLSHFPYVEYGDGPDRGESRYDQYRLPDLGELLLHGHTHGTEKDHGRSLHVGLDAWDLQLVPQSEVLSWVSWMSSEERNNQRQF